MGQILHGSATTTEAIRRAIQNSQTSLRDLAAHYGINPKTVAKWRRRGSVCDARMAPKERRADLYQLIPEVGYLIMVRERELKARYRLHAPRSENRHEQEKSARTAEEAQCNISLQSMLRVSETPSCVGAMIDSPVSGRGV
jgi:hypothetical protein